MVDALAETTQRARGAYARRDWPGAYHALTAVGEAGMLAADDWGVLSDAAWWLGKIDESIAAGEQAYRAFVEDDRPRMAAMAALAIALYVLGRGDEPNGFVWVARCQRLLAEEREGPEHGYLLFVTEVLARLDARPWLDASGFEELAGHARVVRELGRAHGDPTLVVAGTLGEGRALVRLGKVTEGTALLDQVMAALVADELMPEWAGEFHCQLLAAANEVADYRRLLQLCAATTRWLERLPAAVLYNGICRVHRSQAHQVVGEWDRAEQDALLAYRDVVDIAPVIAAEAQYQVGEVRRLRGDATGAERAYRQAHQLGRVPQPGLALLRLAAGKVHAASRSIHAALVEQADNRLQCARLLAAQVKIAVAAHQPDVAVAASEELEDVAALYGTSGLAVMAGHARGLCLLASGRPEAALPLLRDACQRWQQLGAPFECARVRVLLARAYRALDDTDAAALELEAAAATFHRLGAEPDRRVVDELHGQRDLPSGLTQREAEILAYVARGLSNRGIATALVISDKTVARHLSNIYAKLGVASRTAAAAYAVEHGIVASA